MSSDIVEYLKHITNQSNIYGGFIVFCLGMIGNIFNIIIFTSLKTFRETSAAFYMNITSFFNLFQLVVGLLSRIMITGYNIDPTKTSSFICKARQYVLITTMLSIFTCMCFAVIDQFFSMTERWRHYCNVKTASRLVLIATVVLFLHGIVVFIFQDLTPPEGTEPKTCGFTNFGYWVYYTRVLFPFFLGLVPLLTRIIFGLLAFINARRIQSRRIPIVRLERDKQLTTMVLLEVAASVFFTLPYTFYNHFYSYAVSFPTPISSAENQLIIAITRIIFYGNFSVSFYIYYCASSRFRKQFSYVFFDIHLTRWCQKCNQHNENRVDPAISIRFQRRSLNNPTVS